MSMSIVRLETLRFPHQKKLWGKIRIPIILWSKFRKAWLNVAVMHVKGTISIVAISFRLFDTYLWSIMCSNNVFLSTLKFFLNFNSSNENWWNSSRTTKRKTFFVMKWMMKLRYIGFCSSLGDENMQIVVLVFESNILKHELMSFWTLDDFKLSSWKAWSFPPSESANFILDAWSAPRYKFVSITRFKPASTTPTFWETANFPLQFLGIVVLLVVCLVHTTLPMCAK